MAVKRIEHVGIMVRDLERSISFYSDVIGLQLRDKLVHSNGVIKLAFLQFAGAKETEVELIEGYNDQLPQEGKVHHIAFTVDNLEAEVERLKTKQVTFIDDGITTLPNGSRYIFFYGPDGEWIEFFETTR
ncbi:VOC family protein [Brevibacillus humidisoli]|uniref:VOC family protein n=1 Tax=Brevibacillus humidisoli TaxID=2895522 RepID=UPI001E5DFC7A|nr:VOC family protein [Brevibacillus humidisoli]UFJ42052.1 VOC family protein [Brevibacillus humidisoli]